MEDTLPPQDFIRVHRSFIVSIDKIDKFTASNIAIGEKIIPIGRLYKLGVINRLDKYMI